MFCFSRDGEVHGYFVAEAERHGGRTPVPWALIPPGILVGDGLSKEHRLKPMLVGSRRRVRLARVCGVVQARVTSTKPTVVGSIPTGRRTSAVAQCQSIGKTLGPRIPAAKDWDGEGQSYFVVSEAGQ